ncbi:MAG: energy transducer TonB [Xanthomonadales bacterium]|nr:energy transducer TonB [Xanthomonadales bacterium]
MSSATPTRRMRLAGLLAAVLGTVMVLTLLVSMNRQFRKPADDGDEGVSKIAVVKKEKPKPKDVVKPRPKPRKQPQKQAPAPLLGLDSGLAGLDFGLPSFDDSGMDLGKSLLGDSGDVVMTDDSVDQPPRPIQQSPMQYPPRAKAQGVTGYVLLSLLISPTGQVEQVKVLEAQPAGVFDEVAAAGVKTWKFEPAMYKGEQVRVWARQKVRFDLSS